MKLHTTEITAHKLKSRLLQPARSPSLDYSTPADLDSRYRQFCEDARATLDAHSRPAFRRAMTVIKKEKEEELKSLVKGAYKQMSENSRKGILNPVVKIVGNMLIASVFEALILRAIEESTRGGSGVKMADLDGGLSDRMMKSFGIDAFQLRSFKTYRDKRAYIIASMNQTIDRLLRNWREKIDTREKNDDSNEILVECFQPNNQNAFNFLNLKTKYEALRSKLTTTVVQKLNDYENQLKIVETLRQREVRRASLMPIHHDELKVSFSNLEKPSMISQLSTLNNSSFFRRSSSAKSVRNPLKQFNANFLAFNLGKHKPKAKIGAPLRNMSTILTSEILEESFKVNNKAALFGTESTNKLYRESSPSRRKAMSSHLNQFLQETADDNIYIPEKHLKSALIWDKELESDFQKSKNPAKAIFFDEVKRNNWDFVAVRNMVQKLFTEEKKNLQRLEKMKRYGEGDYLTADELKFLADSSELLNACVDKRYLQNACNIIDEGNLHFIELNLAEKIIKKYEEMKEIITNARMGYFRSKNRETKKMIDEFSQTKLKDEQRRAMSEKGQRYKKMIGTIWGMIEKKNDERQLKEDEEIVEEMVLKNFSAKFKKNLSIADLLRKREAQKMREKMSREVVKKPHYQNLISELNNPLVVKHRFHPSSKLHKIEAEEKKSKEDQYLHHIENIEQEYKISIKCPGTIRVQRNFAKFYSGGPKVNQSELLYDPMTGDSRQAKPNEVRAIIRIQARIRGLMARTRFKRLLENHKNRKFVEAQERIFSKHLRKLQNKDPDSSPSNFSPHSFYARKLKEMNKGKLLRAQKSSILSEDPNPSSSREDKIRNREPPKSLLLKHRKLLEAAVKDNFFMVNNSGFIYYHSDVNIRDKQGNTALYYTSGHANLDFSAFLLRNGAKVNIKCFEGDTPFHMAFKSNNLDMIMTLIEHGGDLNCLNMKSQTPLAFASRSMLELLDLTEGVATVNERNAEALSFDNNKLLFKFERKNGNFNAELAFKFDRLRRMTMKVREKGKVVEFEDQNLGN